MDYDSPILGGATLEVYAIGGSKVLETRIRSNPHCFHVIRVLFSIILFEINFLTTIKL